MIENKDNGPSQIDRIEAGIRKLDERYGEKVKEASKIFWQKATDVASEVEGNLALLGIAMLVPIIPGVYSGADVMVALNGIDEYNRGEAEGNKNLRVRGMIKTVISVVPCLPSSWAAPIVDKALPISKK